MAQNVKIAIVGDYNETFSPHAATNAGLKHAGVALKVDVLAD